MQTPTRYIPALFVVLLLVAGCGGPIAQNSTATAMTPVIIMEATEAPTVADAASTAAPEASPTAASEASPTAADPLQAIANSIHSFGAITSYRMMVVIAGDTPSQNSTINIEIAGKDYHFVSSRGTEFFLIGDTFYLKQNANAKWRKLASNSPEAAGVTAALQASKESLSSSIAAHSATLIGADVLAGKPMLVYQYTLNNAPAKIWVGVTDGLPYQLEATSSTGAKTTVTISDYNAQIVLTPPVP